RQRLAEDMLGGPGGDVSVSPRAFLDPDGLWRIRDDLPLGAVAPVPAIPGGLDVERTAVPAPVIVLVRAGVNGGPVPRRGQHPLRAVLHVGFHEGRAEDLGTYRLVAEAHLADSHRPPP